MENKHSSGRKSVTQLKLSASIKLLPFYTICCYSLQCRLFSRPRQFRNDFLSQLFVTVLPLHTATATYMWCVLLSTHKFGTCLLERKRFSSVLANATHTHYKCMINDLGDKRNESIPANQFIMLSMKWSRKAIFLHVSWAWSLQRIGKCVDEFQTGSVCVRRSDKRAIWGG